MFSLLHEIHQAQFHGNQYTKCRRYSCPTFEQQDAATAAGHHQHPNHPPLPTQNDESDDEDVDEVFDEVYEQLGDKYIEDNMCAGYEKENVCFILYLHHEFPMYLNDNMKAKMDDLTTAHMSTKALKFAKSVTTSHCPIRLADLPVKVFTKFLYHHLVAESNGKHYLLKIGIGGYRSALQDIF